MVKTDVNASSSSMASSIERLFRCRQPCSCTSSYREHPRAMVAWSSYVFSPWYYMIFHVKWIGSSASSELWSWALGRPLRTYENILRCQSRMNDTIYRQWSNHPNFPWGVWSTSRASSPIMWSHVSLFVFVIFKRSVHMCTYVIIRQHAPPNHPSACDSTQPGRRAILSLLLAIFAWVMSHHAPKPWKVIALLVNHLDSFGTKRVDVMPFFANDPFCWWMVWTFQLEKLAWAIMRRGSWKLWKFVSGAISQI